MTSRDPASAEDLPPLPDCRVWWIDGYNLLHAALGSPARGDGPWWTAERRDALRARVEGFRAPHDEIRLIFDGPHPAPEDAANRLQVVFAPSADEWIRTALRDCQEPSRVAIVTGDRPVADRARHRGAKVVSPRAFLAWCARPEADA